MPGCHRSRVTKVRPTGSDVEGNVVVGVGEVESDMEETGPGVGAWGSVVVMIVAAEIGSRGDCRCRHDAHLPHVPGAYR